MGNIVEIQEMEEDRLSLQLKKLEQEVNPPLPPPEKKKRFIEENIGLIFILGIVALGLAAYFAGLIKL